MRRGAEGGMCVQRETQVCERGAGVCRGGQVCEERGKDGGAVGRMWMFALARQSDPDKIRINPCRIYANAYIEPPGGR